MFVAGKTAGGVRPAGTNGTPSSSRDRLPRISIVAPSLAILGGHGVAAQLLISALRADGYDVDLLPINPPLPAALAWVRRIRVVRTVVNQLLFLPSLRHLSRVDVVHVFSASYWSFLLAPAPTMLAGRLFRKRLVLHYHSGEAADHLENWGVLVHPWLRLADEIVVPSAFLQRTFAKHSYPTTVIQNFIDATQFTFRERGQLGPHLLSTRNLEPHYAVATTLQAFKLIKARCPDATLTVAGTGSEAVRLCQIAEVLRLEGVRFAGRIEQEDMPGLCAAADVFVNASVIDNQPLSILEAFAAGLPVVTTPTGAIAEMVSDGRTGAIFPPGDPAAMADAVCRLVEQPARVLALTTQAREHLRGHVWDALRDSWAAVYDGRPTTGKHARLSDGRVDVMTGQTPGRSPS